MQVSVDCKLHAKHQRILLLKCSEGDFNAKPMESKVPQSQYGPVRQVWRAALPHSSPSVLSIVPLVGLQLHLVCLIIDLTLPAYNVLILFQSHAFYDFYFQQVIILLLFLAFSLKILTDTKLYKLTAQYVMFCYMYILYNHQSGSSFQAFNISLK